MVADRPVATRSGQDWGGGAQGADLGVGEGFLKELATSESVSCSSCPSLPVSAVLTLCISETVFQVLHSAKPQHPSLALCLNPLECFSVSLSL